MADSKMKRAALARWSDFRDGAPQHNNPTGVAAFDAGWKAALATIRQEMRDNPAVAASVIVAVYAGFYVPESSDSEATP